MVTKTTRRTTTRKTATQKKTQRVRVTLTVDSALLTPAQVGTVKAKLQAKYRGKPNYKISVISAGKR